MSDPNNLMKQIVDGSEPATSPVNDLRELGTQYAGYRPLPSQGQTIVSFEAEELAKHGLTWSQFIDTEFYRQNADLYKDLLRDAPGSTPQELMAAQAAQTVAANTTAQVSPAVSVNSVIVTENALIIHTPGPSEVRGQGFDIALLAPPTPPIKNAFPSSVMIKSSTRKFFHRMIMTPDLQFVPSVDEKFGPLEMLRWEEAVIRKYGGIYVGIQNEYDPADRSVKTLDSQAGFPMRAHYMNNIHADSKGPLLDRFRRHQAPTEEPEPFVYARNVNYYGLPEEMKVISALSAIEEKNLYEVPAFHESKKLFDGSEVRLKSLNPNLILEKTRVWFDHQFTNYSILMDKDDSFKLLVADMVMQHISKNMRIARQEDRKALTEIFKMVKFDKTKVTFASSIADEIMRADGPTTFKVISQCMMLSRWVQCGFNLTLSVVSMPVLIGLCVAKLITPRYMWSQKDILMCDNYIARWLLRSLPIFAGRMTTEDFEREENQLQTMLNNPANWRGNSAQDLAALRDFLTSWSDSDTPGVFGLNSINGEAVNRHISNASGSTEMFHRDFISWSSTDAAYTVKSGPMQYAQLRRFERFAAVIDSLSQRRNTWRNFLKMELIEPMARTFTEIANRSEHIREMMFHFNMTHRGLSLHTLTGNYATGQSLSRVTLHNLDPAAFANIIFTVEPDSILSTRFDDSFYQKSLSIHKLLSDFGDGLAIVRRYLKKPKWSSSERITEAAKFVPDHPLKAWVMEELIRRRKTVPFESFRPRQYLTEKISAVSTFFRSLTPSLLGYAPSYIFANGDEKAIQEDNLRRGFRLLYVSKKMQDLHSLDIKGLESLVLRGELGKWLADHPGPVRFNIPVRLTEGPPAMSFSMPFALDQEKVTIGSLHVGFRDADDEVRHFTDDLSLLIPRTYLSEITPWVDVPADFPLSRMVHVRTVWSELDIGYVEEYMRLRPV